MRARVPERSNARAGSKRCANCRQIRGVREEQIAAALGAHESGLDGRSLPFPDDSFDAAVSTWTMCTVPEIDVALAELRRVLVPGGELHFVEHGLAPDDAVQRWQHRLNPVQRRLFGGCNLNRPIVELVSGAGFRIEELDVFYEPGAPRFLGAQSLGVAVTPN